jgi:hypothetical protein
MAVLALASLAAVGLVAAPAQAQILLCTKLFQNTTIEGSVQVPDGEVCQLINVTVLGNASAGAGADLLMERTVVQEVTAAASAFVFADRSVLHGGVSLDQSFGLLAEDSIVFGVKVSGGDPFNPTIFFSDGSNVIGNVSTSVGWTILQDGRVTGFVDTFQDQATDLFRMRVSGLSIEQAADGTVVCNTNSHGITSVTGSQGFIQLGGPFSSLMCDGNRFLGDLEVHDNSAVEIQISANLITGDLNCTGNTPAPVGNGNIILGTASGQCADLGTVQDGLLPAPGEPGDEEAITEGERVAEPAALLQSRLGAALQGSPTTTR